MTLYQLFEKEFRTKLSMEEKVQKSFKRALDSLWCNSNAASQQLIWEIRIVLSYVVGLNHIRLSYTSRQCKAKGGAGKT